MDADNQQERFIPKELGNYLAGFADGEGSFNVSFRKRNDYKLPWKISLCFNISQKEFEILKLFQTTIGCGSMRDRPDGVWYYEVNNTKQIGTKIPRDYTPNSDKKFGDDIVRTPWRHGEADRNVLLVQ